MMVLSVFVSVREESHTSSVFYGQSKGQVGEGHERVCGEDDHLLFMVDPTMHQPPLRASSLLHVVLSPCMLFFSYSFSLRTLSPISCIPFISLFNKFCTCMCDMTMI